MPQFPITIGLAARLPFRLQKRKKWFLSSCPILDIHSQGATEQEAVENLKAALSLFFITSLEIGTLDTVLKDCGFHVGTVRQEFEQLSDKNILEVPIPLYWGKEKQVACHA